MAQAYEYETDVMSNPETAFHVSKKGCWEQTRSPVVTVYIMTRSMTEFVLKLFSAHYWILRSSIVTS